MPHLLDSHVHLQEPELAADLAHILDTARTAGVSRVLCNGSSPADWQRVAQIAADHRDVIPCFGLHPWYVGNRPADWLDQLRGWVTSRPSAVGEIGIDRWIEPRNEADQEHVFRQQLALARELGRPAMVHCLRAWGWLMEIFQVEKPPERGMLIHAYGGSVELIAPLAKLGAYFSFAGNAFEAKRSRAREAMAAVPLDRLLIETDAPDLLPPEEYRAHAVRDAQGSLRNHPANLPAILRGVAAVRRMEETELAGILWENARRFLGPLLGG